MRKTVAAIAVLAVAGASPLTAQDSKMSFFVTSAGSGDGANLGGIAGADQRCQDLAYGVGFADITWRAYLSTVSLSGRGRGAAVGGQVNARDRIGEGPWYNYKGDLIANTVEELHSDRANLTKQTILTEKGNMVNGRDDSPNTHDILTGSTMDGMASTAEGHDACRNWTSNSTGSAMLGHHDRQGGGQNPTSWNSAHASRGCSQENLQATGGNGYFYCFAIDAAHQRRDDE